ncbi:MAG: site-specific integrase [Mesorhizobium sp.]|nr:MAG: site-specific integrase [Mesorhizobium sp.]
MATIRRRGQKYEAQIRRSGFPPVSKSFHKLSDAKEWARLIETQADRQELAPSRKSLETTILSDLVIRHRDEVVPTKKGGDVETIVLNAFLRHPICKQKLSTLSTSDFASYRDERLQTITSKTLKRQLAPLQNMFEHAKAEWGVPLRENPLAKLTLKVIDNKRQRRLREGELSKLLEAGKKTRNRYVVLIVRFALETAMRRGEILALRLRDIDMGRQTVTVRESKNGYSRTIPLSPAAILALGNALAKMTDEEEKNAIVFPITPLALRLSWYRLTKRAKISDLHFHDLRHEAISRLFELGLTVPEVASISGHRDMRMLFRYAHANHASIRAKLLAAE